ncbi:hypothetical protein LRS10_05705 [Phenylobacterium sp. J426]|nr:hypothetical protein [Phenylobacterium sp. J426]MCR5873713.1 hypothetical protein [Phenylobacterium sp. J426]
MKLASIQGGARQQPEGGLGRVQIGAHGQLVDAGHDAVGGRDDRGEVLVQPGALQLGSGLQYRRRTIGDVRVSAQRRQGLGRLLLGHGQLVARLVGGVHGLVDRLARDGPGRVELALAGHLTRREPQILACGGDARDLPPIGRPRLADRQLGVTQLGLGEVDARLQITLIQAEQHLAAPNRLVLLHIDFDDAAADRGRHRRLGHLDVGVVGGLEAPAGEDQVGEDGQDQDRPHRHNHPAPPELAACGSSGRSRPLVLRCTQVPSRPTARPTASQPARATRGHIYSTIPYVRQASSPTQRREGDTAELVDVHLVGH